jgi:hypothetical protein
LAVADSIIYRLLLLPVAVRSDCGSLPSAEPQRHEAEAEMGSRDDVKVMVLTDLATICRKLADDPAVLEDLRVRAAEFVSEYESFREYRGRSNNAQHQAGENLLVRIARFLPRIADMMPDSKRSLDIISQAV